MEEFVAKLKALAGPNALVQVVGIGKGREDLTAAVIHPTKTNPVSTSRHEIPPGKAWSEFSTEEIIKFVNGYFRLSKAQADDLFWEAVWPRLLAKGWHSEKPDKGAYELRQRLVFLIPGVQTFSRKDLTKGIHYFDSVSEVLSWVASDPRLLELDTHGITGVEVKPECFHTSENADKENGHAGHPCSYLQPKQVQSLIFTVVDTSLTSQGVGTPRIRERVTLPLDDGSDRSQTVSWETEDTDNLGIQSTDSLFGNKINNNSRNSRICKLTSDIVPDLNLPYDQPINMKINCVSDISIQVSQASKSEETSYSEANSGHSQEVFNNPGVAQSSSPDPDESHSIKPQENNESTLQGNVRRQSTRVRPLTTKALEAFACGFSSPKRRRKGNEKTLNPDGCRMKSNAFSEYS